MHKHVLTLILCDEAESLFVVEPLHFAACHNYSWVPPRPPDSRQPAPSGIRRCLGERSIVNERETSEVTDSRQVAV
jgi:hypothetical protein